MGERRHGSLIQPDPGLACPSPFRPAVLSCKFPLALVLLALLQFTNPQVLSAADPAAPVRSPVPPASSTPGVSPSATPSPEPAENRTASLQLQGDLVCPPLRLEPGLIILATRDRRLQAVDSLGRLLWKLDFPRQPKGPLRSGRPGLIELPMSGDRLVLVDRRGRLAADFDAPWDDLVHLSGGRWIALDAARSPPDLVWLHPGGKPLFTLPLGPGAAGIPAGNVEDKTSWHLENHGIGALLEYHPPAGSGAAARAWYLAPEGRLREVQSTSPHLPDALAYGSPLTGNLSSGSPEPAPAPTMPGARTAAPVLGFFPGKNASGYTLRIESPAARLDFQGTGSLGHWLADNREPFLCVWGDSRWKLHLFPARDLAGKGFTPPVPKGPLVPKLAEAGIPAVPILPVEEETAEERQAGLLELRYFRDLEIREPLDPVGVFSRQFDLLVSANKLPGRLDLLEDHLLELLEQVSAQSGSDTRAGRAACIALLSKIPSTRILDQALSHLAREKSPRVVLAWQEWFALLPGDPDGRIQSALAGRFQALGLAAAGFDAQDRRAFAVLKDRLRPKQGK